MTHPALRIQGQAGRCPGRSSHVGEQIVFCRAVFSAPSRLADPGKYPFPQMSPELNGPFAFDAAGPRFHGSALANLGRAEPHHRLARRSFDLKPIRDPVGIGPQDLAGQRFDGYRGPVGHGVPSRIPDLDLDPAGRLAVGWLALSLAAHRNGRGHPPPADVHDKPARFLASGGIGDDGVLPLLQRDADVAVQAHLRLGCLHPGADPIF